MKEVQSDEPSQSNQEQGPVAMAIQQDPDVNNGADTEEGLIINMTHPDDLEELVWDSDVDSNSSTSTTSTPEFKRGRHVQHDIQKAVDEILADSKKFSIGSSPHRQSLDILADSRLQNWSDKDKLCKIEYRPGWGFRQWLAALRAETIRISCNAVLLYFEKSTTFDDAPPLKNNLEAICKVIRQHKRGVKIFVSNLLPQPSHSPVGKPRVESNYILLQAVRSVNQFLKKVHFLSVYEHFMSSKGKIIKPTHKYFQDNQQLTSLGCLMVRECWMQEAGLKTYWF